MPEQTSKTRGRSIDTISERRRQKLERVLRARQRDLALVIENVWDPHNVSACLRSADAVGIQDVHFLYYIEQAPNMKRLGKQSSASAKKWLTFHQHTDVRACFDALRADGFAVYVSHLTRDAVPLYNLDLTGKVALVFGNEHRGVSAEATEAADGVFFIPMMGMVQSLNISVATAVTLYEACRQRLAAGAYDREQIPGDTLRQLLEDWARM
jgi:tRNA (guanosine-2'-O-)-methyltransferase